MSDRLPHETPSHPEPVAVGHIDRGNGNEIRVGIIEGPGRPRIDARLWYRPDGDEPSPTRKGLRMSLAEAHQLVSLLDQAIELAERRARRTGGVDGR